MVSPINGLVPYSLITSLNSTSLINQKTAAVAGTAAAAAVVAVTVFG